ncbi:MAG: hypothetical protein LWX83_01830 [Anaerolineae bacterium]|nr:hypothetical protein [Anaerolineae bacterium]
MSRKTSIFLPVIKTLCITGLVIIFCFVFLNFPLPRQTGLTARYDLVLTFIPLILVSYGIFRLPGQWGSWFAPLFMALLLCLPLSGLWASGNSEQYVLGGSIQLSDSANYYIDALRFLEGGRFSSFSSDRPLMVSFFAGLLSVTGRDFKAALILSLILPILSMYISAREVQRSAGALPAAIFTSVLFMFYRRYTGLVMSEMLGISLGLLAFTFLWRYFTQPRKMWLVTGLGLLTLALIARLGAFFILPLLLLWLVWECRKHGWPVYKMLFVTIAVMALAFGINRLVYDWVAEPGVRSNPQFTFHLYALVTGGGYWGDLLNHHSELNALQGNDYLRRALQISWDYFVQHPTDLLLGIYRDLAAYFSDPIRGEFSYIDGASDTVNLVFRLALAVLSLLGITSLFKQDQSKRVFIWMCIIGLLFSIPFVPPTATFKLRLLASTIWLQALLPALGLAWIAGFLPHPIKNLETKLPPAPQLSDTTIKFLPLVVVPLLLLIPAFLRMTAQATILPPSSCPAGQETVYVRLEPASYIVLVDHEDPRQGWMPYIRLNYFMLKMHNIPHATIISFFEGITEPVAMIYGLELKSSQQVLVLAPPEQLVQEPGLVQACGHYQEKPLAYTETFFLANQLDQTGLR